MVKRKAYAKINLCLDVLRKRDDGYHDLRMIMQTVGIYDELEFMRADEASLDEGDSAVSGYIESKSGGRISLIVKDLPENVDLGPAKDNLVLKSAGLLYDEFDIKTDVIITLKKNIPVAAGMAGGSTDAAAVFHGLNELLALNMTKEHMCRLGVMVGADVPYCIMGGTMLSEGIGDILTPLCPPPGCYLLVAKPAISVSTGYVYGNLRLDESTYHPDVDAMINAISNHDLAKIASLLGNTLESVTEKKYPIISVIKQSMIDNGGLGSLMSGSGPTVFGIFDDKDRALLAKDVLTKEHPDAEVILTGFTDLKQAALPFGKEKIGGSYAAGL